MLTPIQLEDPHDAQVLAAANAQAAAMTWAVLALIALVAVVALLRHVRLGCVQIRTVEPAPKYLQRPNAA